MAITAKHVEKYLRSGILFGVEGRSHTLDIPITRDITLIIMSIRPELIVVMPMWLDGAKSVAHGAAMAIAVSGILLAKIWQYDTTHYRCQIWFFENGKAEPLVYSL